ncbi:MAG: hypothetical protein ACNYPI_12110 [Arenicellales bacterium WSBS_2016_MAG_OTU3]
MSGTNGGLPEGIATTITNTEWLEKTVATLKHCNRSRKAGGYDLSCKRGDTAWYRAGISHLTRSQFAPMG